MSRPRRLPAILLVTISFACASNPADRLDRLEGRVDALEKEAAAKATEPESEVELDDSPDFTDANWSALLAAQGLGADDTFFAMDVPADAGLAYNIGTWNLEGFSPCADRGFPELRGANELPPRVEQAYEQIARIIDSELDLKLLLLQEVNWASMEILRGKLGGEWDYEISDSGGRMRTAILYDVRYVELVDGYYCEGAFYNKKITELDKAKGTFDRQPLSAHVRFKHDGQPMNDLTVMSVHLASQQARVKNHDYAMRKIIGDLASAEPTACLPAEERDIVVAGDFNANMYDSYEEEFWAEMESAGWKVLAGETAADYPATRLSGKPLKPGNSRIDYVIASGGLVGEEITASAAWVNLQIPKAKGYDAYRSCCSDHIPVTVGVSVVEDDD